MYTCNSTGAIFANLYLDSACTGEVISVENVGQADTCYMDDNDRGSEHDEYFKVTCGDDGQGTMDFYAGYEAMVDEAGSEETQWICIGEVTKTQMLPSCDPQCDDDSSDGHHGSSDGGHSDRRRRLLQNPPETLPPAQITSEVCALECMAAANDAMLTYARTCGADLMPHLINSSAVYGCVCARSRLSSNPSVVLQALSGSVAEPSLCVEIVSVHSLGVPISFLLRLVCETNTPRQPSLHASSLIRRGGGDGGQAGGLSVLGADWHASVDDAGGDGGEHLAELRVCDPWRSHLLGRGGVFRRGFG